MVSGFWDPGVMEVLTVNPTGDPRSQPDAAVTTPGTELLGFDLLAIHSLTTRTEQVGNVSRYGPVPILRTKKGNTRAVISALGVRFNPHCAMFRWAWFPQIARGAVQEADITTTFAQDSDLGRSYAGRMWGTFGSLGRPQLIRIEVDPESVFQITAVIGSNVLTQPLNFYVRVIGFYQTVKR